LIQASLSLSSPPSTAARFRAGPLEIALDAPVGPLRDLLESTFSLYDVTWTLTAVKSVHLSVEVVTEPSAEQARGNYLECAQMLVDVTSRGLRATTARGAAMVGTEADEHEAWHMTVPERIVAEGWWPEIEDLVSLIVTTGWRRSGWVPLHAAGLVKNGRGLLVCASSRGGKTTFSLAMARRGWRIVGDDKLLVGLHDGRTIVAAVKHMLNVDPATRRWFDEVGDLTPLPIYSQWSPKRRVPLASIFPDASALSMTPTHVVALERVARRPDVSVQPLDIPETISTLLHQTVVPTEPRVARLVSSTVAALGSRLRGVRLQIPDEVYGDAAALDPFERAL
jgi:hypothetical protein